MLEAFLDFYRTVLARKLAGVSDAAAREIRTPTGMSLGGIVRHMAGVEQWWFIEALHGTGPRYDWTDAEYEADRDCEWKLDESHTVEHVLAYYERACAEARAAAAGVSMDAVAALPTIAERGNTLRWIYVHMIEETARHAGHADILREQIDGATGD